MCMWHNDNDLMLYNGGDNINITFVLKFIIGIRNNLRFYFLTFGDYIRLYISYLNNGQKKRAGNVDSEINTINNIHTIFTRQAALLAWNIAFSFTKSSGQILIAFV